MTHDNADATAANGTAGELVARLNTIYNEYKALLDQLTPEQREEFYSQQSLDFTTKHPDTEASADAPTAGENGVA